MLFLHSIHANIAGSRWAALGPLTSRDLGLGELPVSPFDFAAKAAAHAGRGLAGTAIPRSRAAAGRPEQPELLARVALEPGAGCLRAQPPVGAGPGARPLEVPLLLAEVAHVRGGAAGGAQIAVVPRRGPATGPGRAAADGEEEACVVWLVTLEGDETALLAVLDALSALGAVRSGLQKSFVVSSEELGSGGCATVYLAQLRGGGSGASRPAAIKLAREPGSEADKALLDEVPLLAAVQGHVNVVRFLGIFRAANVFGHVGSQWALALMCSRDGDLQNWVFQKGPQSEAFASEIQRGLLSALAHVHSRGIVHRDVKSENVLIVDGGKSCVLTDFGLAALALDAAAMSVPCGSVGYVAPEVLRREVPYGNKVDVFGAGVTLYYTLSRALPFTGGSAAQVLRRNLRCIVALESNEDLQQLGPLAKDFLTSLLQAAPEQRPAAVAALAHAWLAPCQRRPAAAPALRASLAPPRLAAAPLEPGDAEGPTEPLQGGPAPRRHSATTAAGRGAATWPPTLCPLRWGLSTGREDAEGSTSLATCAHRVAAPALPLRGTRRPVTARQHRGFRLLTCFPAARDCHGASTPIASTTADSEDTCFAGLSSGVASPNEGSFPRSSCKVQPDDLCKLDASSLVYFPTVGRAGSLGREAVGSGLARTGSKGSRGLRGSDAAVPSPAAVAAVRDCGLP